MSKEVDPLSPPAGGGVSGEEMEAPLSPPVGGGVNGEGMSAICSSANRWWRFSKG